MKKRKPIPARSLIRQALNWGANSVEAMIDCYRVDGKLPEGDHPDAEHVASLVHLHNSMLAYRKKRFGWTYDPTHGAQKMDARTRQPVKP